MNHVSLVFRRKAVLKQPLQPIDQGKAGHRHDMTELQEVEEGIEDATAPLRGGCCTEDEELAFYFNCFNICLCILQKIMLLFFYYFFLQVDWQFITYKTETIFITEKLG